jgi:hypothetical protein
MKEDSMLKGDEIGVQNFGCEIVRKETTCMTR